jgi:2-methylcitrate dehydratase PrpD
MPTCSEQLSEWAGGVQYADLPEHVVHATRLRVLDVIGLALAGLGTPFGQSVFRAVAEMHPAGPCRILGTATRSSAPGAALANGALAQALEFDDTHNESIVHMSSPSVVAALALADLRPVTGRELIAAIAVGNEISCRIGCVAPGQFHRRGFHPTGLFATFGAAWLAGKLLRLTVPQMTNGAGIAGSFASGLLECWVDGTQSKFLHPGWAAQSGIAAAFLARAGVTGPATVIEGRFGLFESHLQDKAAARDFTRITKGLGAHWESRNASFKPFPAAHVIHPYIDAMLHLKRRHAIDPDQVDRIHCPVAAYIVPIVCEPLAEKRRPRSDSHGRVSLQYTLAEALVRGRIGKDAYGAESLSDPRILRLADVVDYAIDPEFPGPARFMGAVTVCMRDGSRYDAVEEHNRGSAANPMRVEDLIGKFNENAAGVLPPGSARRVVDVVLVLERMADARELIDLATIG